MRYVDGPTVECDLHVAADPARVWKLVTDVELPTRFSPELRRVRWLDGSSGPALGARFEGHNHNPALGEWRTISHVVRFDEPRVFGWLVLDPDNRFGGGPADPEHPAATWQFRLTPERDGCRLSQWVRIGPGRTGLSLFIDRAPENEEKIIEFRLAALREAMTTTLQGIRNLAERPR
ncbi:Polyketide cyclase / dehydrase and lipid transport [Micromonospora citrea]|uniref:Polyketide cyclase / dehydrase and lipid transport n=1 Tax=Micromonospora citrea TaxID=47855 RepID=A0A1C6TRU4_9ACTN|nr:SRPBCC family protein [Micromonospora citrea]SCL44388.1 Polyketide cyclase / dehydrase and lipid transport [Micromonospora citrea]